MAERKRIAAIVTAFFPAPHGSHADLVVSKFAKGFPTSDGRIVEPEVDLVSMYVDQPHWTGMETELAREYGIELHQSIRGALTMTPQGRPGHWTPEDDERPGDLAVDGVLIVAEHGDYAGNERQRHLYPRRYFFEQVCGVFAMSGRSVPVFNDKHLAYDWRDALWMYERARELGVPFMAGSALPLCSRGPELEHEPDTPIEEALSIGYIHPFLFGLDSYGFHALEGLQCMVERRDGGESGIAAVQCLEGDAVWEAGERGLWSRELGRGCRGPRGEAAPSAAVRRTRGNVRRPGPAQGGRADGGQLPEPGRLHPGIRRRPSRRHVAVTRTPPSVRVRRQGERPGGEHGLHSNGRSGRALHLPGPEHPGDVRHRPAAVPGGAHSPGQRSARLTHGVALQGTRPGGDAPPERGVQAVRPRSDTPPNGGLTAPARVTPKSTTSVIPAQAGIQSPARVISSSLTPGHACDTDYRRDRRCRRALVLLRPIPASETSSGSFSQRRISAMWRAKWEVLQSSWLCWFQYSL